MRTISTFTKLLLLFSLISAQTLTAQNSIFKVPSKIQKKCNHYLKLDYTIQDSLQQSIYFYFEDAVMDTVIQRMDSVQYADPLTCEMKDTIAIIEGIKVVQGKIYILDNSGNLLNPKPYDNVKFTYYGRAVSNCFVPTCICEVFCGYDFIYDYYTFYEFGSSGDANIELTSEFLHILELPLLVKQKGKWGLMNLDGIMLIPCSYDSIEFAGYKKYNLFNKNILVETIEL